MKPKFFPNGTDFVLDHSPLVRHNGCAPECKELLVHTGEGSQCARRLLGLPPGQPGGEGPATSSELDTSYCSSDKQSADT